MDVERIIDDIEQLQEMFEAPDIRPLSASDISAANRRHDETFSPLPVVSALAAIMAFVAELSLRYSDYPNRDLNFRRNFEHESGRPIRASNLSVFRRRSEWKAPFPLKT